MRIRNLMTTFGVGVLAVSSVMVAPGVAAAVTAPTAATAIATVMTTYDPTQYYGAPHHDDGTVIVPYATAKDGIVFNVPSTAGAVSPNGIGIRLSPPTGGTLARGVYTGVSGTPSASKPGMQITQASQGHDPTAAEFDVLDLATDAAGNYTRLDIVFVSDVESPLNAVFGEFRMGESEPAVRFSANHVRFPTTPTKSTPTWLEESVRNTSSTSAVIGAPKLAAGATGDYRLADDHCSTAPVAAGASCTFRVGFLPTAGGPRNATMTVAVNGANRTIDLAGSAPLGTTRITASGYSWLSGKTTEADGKYVLSGPSGGFFDWRVNAVYGAPEPGTFLRITSPSGGSTIPKGTQPLIDPGFDPQTGMAFSINGEGCGSVMSNGFSPTITVYDFTTDSSGHVLHAHVTWKTDCDPLPGVPEQGELLWRNRSDFTSPTAVSGLTATTTSVRWTQSPSTDVHTDVVRLVPGNGAGATPTSGVGVSFALGTTASLPALQPGASYSVVVFPVDTAGNVGAASTAHVVG